MKTTLVSRILIGGLLAGSAIAVNITVNSTAAHSVPSTLCKLSLLITCSVKFVRSLTDPEDGQMFEVSTRMELQSFL